MNEAGPRISAFANHLIWPFGSYTSPLCRELFAALTQSIGGPTVTLFTSHAACLFSLQFVVG
jgi:hypothetical protein